MTRVLQQCAGGWRQFGNKTDPGGCAKSKKGCAKSKKDDPTDRETALLREFVQEP